jgi:hypothetical protein
MDLLACTWIEMNPLETAQSNQRSSLDRRKLQIKLHDFISRRLCSIRHYHIGIDPGRPH